MNLKKIGFFLLLFFCAFVAKAQYYDSGQDPSNISWRQINTQYFQIIFPDYYENQALFLAKNLDSVCDAVEFSLPVKSKRIPLLLHTQSAMSNGLVVWAPKREEWWTCAPQQTFQLPWFEQLGIHEYRHVVQIENVEEGFSGILATIFGQHITGAIVGLFVPNWFLEGDATASETSLSNVGRGRSADFQMELRAQLEDKGTYSYDKALQGSFKDYIPNRYILGYHLVAYGRINYGFELWQNSLRNVARKPWLLNPFEHGIKQTTSLNMKKFYKTSMQFYDSLWRAMPQENFLQEKQRKSAPAKVYTNYYSPTYINDSTIIALKESLEEIEHFIYISGDGKETKIYNAASVYNDDLDFFEGRILWSELQPHPRWAQQVFTNIVELDLKSRKKRRITRESRYFSPRYSKDGQIIIAIEDDKLNEQSIVLLNAETGKEIHRSHTFSPMRIISPCLAPTDSLLFFIGANASKRDIYTYNWYTKTIKIFFDFNNANLSFLQFHKNKLFFISDFQGVSQAYALDISNKELFLITDARFGIKNYTITPHNKIIYNTYSGNGYFLEENELIYKKQSFSGNTDAYPIAEKLSGMEKVHIEFSNFDIDTSFKIEKYHKWRHLLYFHSWAPVAIDPTAQTFIGSGFSIMSQNILSTSFLETGYIWYSEEGRSGVYLDYTYKGFFPIWTSNIGFRGRKTTTSNYDITWSELSFGSKIRIPLNFNNEGHIYGLSPSFYYEFKEIFPGENYTSTVRNNNLISIGTFLYYQEQKALKLLYPRWGQNLSIYMNKNFNNGDNSWLFSIYGNAYFPAFLSTHSFYIYSGYQRNVQGSFVFSNQVSLPRGYNNMISENLFSNKINYTLPLLYPDMALGRFLYMKRIYANLFYDFMWYSQPAEEVTFDYSAGIELNFNVNVFRLEFPMVFGVRFSCMPSIKDYSFDFLFSFSI